MDLRSLVLRRIVPRVFLVTDVGGRRARLAAERLIRARGWRLALSPGEANMLVLCAPAHHGLGDIVDRLWGQLPGPRARTHIAAADEAEERLAAAATALTDLARQRHDAATRSPTEWAPADSAGRQPAEPDHGDHEMTGHDGHEMTGHDGHDMTGHGGHDMGAMRLPGGLRMARRGPDRDGLKLDQLHVPLGPALPDWPAGLVVRLTLQGDVVQRALVEPQVPGRHGAVPADHATAGVAGAVRPDAAARPDPADGADSVARGPADRLDSLQRLLSVAGWPAAAVQARRLRDRWVGGPEPAARRDYERWSRRVRRSRLLRWSTDGVGVLGTGVPESLRGDATARWMRWLDGVGAGLVSSPADDARAAVDALPDLLVGQELAAVRLIVASLDPDLDALAASCHPEPAHG